MDIEYGTDHATVTLVSDITDETVIELAAAMRHLHSDCYYDWAHLQIASDGGAERALSHWLAVADDLRERGLRIVTRGLTSVGSAAAVILSLGDRREAASNTRLQYHGIRTAAGGTHTAEQAAYQADFMGRFDSAILARLAEKALTAAVDDLPAYEPTIEDQLVANHLTAQVDWSERDAQGKRGDDALSRLRRLVAWCAAGPKDRFVALYGHLFRLDQVISAMLARELALIDHIANGGSENSRERPTDAFSVPQWSALFPPSGEVARDALCRHVLVLGEPGAGKTASAILPVVSAVCDAQNKAGCALVIDPKRELKDVVDELADVDLRVFRPRERGGVRQIIDVMASPEWSIEADLAAGRVKTAARKILLRSASLAPGSPAATLNGSAPTGDPYWEMEGAKLALTVVATTLALFRSAAWRSPRGSYEGANKRYWRELHDFARLAGMAKTPDDGQARPNVLALGNHVLARFFGPNCMTLAVKLAVRFRKATGEIREIADDVRQWAELADNTSGGHYMGVHSMARQAFGDFGNGTAARTLYFGCEPGLRAGLASGDMVAIAFGRDVDATDGRTVYLYQPSLSASHDILIARSLKASFFETILGSAKRSRAGHGMPLAAYIADEAHRFVTCDTTHGEQSFMDTCRSFATCCVLASQSISSLRHALGDANPNGTAVHAVEMLLANTATKLFFRSTDAGSQQYVRDLCPLTPGRPSVADVRPLSTLRPGECYAVLADGRMERRRLGQFDSPRLNTTLDGLREG